MEKKTILLIEDDNAFNTLLTHFLKRNNYEVLQAFSAKQAFNLLEKHPISIILSDLRLPDQDGISILKELRSSDNQTAFVLMTAYADVQTAVEAMKIGAADYISKPFVPEEVLLVLKKINSSAKSPKTPEKQQIIEIQKNDFHWGKSTASLQLKKFIDLVAPTPLTVLITGESGTGKEVVAKT